MSLDHDDDKQLMVIDTDCGIDDALAIMLALSFNATWKILAITCCAGNTCVDNACNNVLKVLHLCGQKEIPVYRGCERPLLAAPPVTTVHGDDGLGNVGNEYSSGNLTVSEGHAVNILVQLAKKHKGKINLVALAPLTNIAMAHRLDPEFTSNLKSITFMGGNIHAVGNVTPTAEFNFYCDPEAAHIVISESKCPVTMIPWETTLKHGIDWDFYNRWINQETTVAEFIKNTSADIAQLCKDDECNGFLDCDFLAMVAVLDRESVKITNFYKMSVETRGIYTRGQVIAILSQIHRTNEEIFVRVVEEFDDGILKDLRNQILNL